MLDSMNGNQARGQWTIKEQIIGDPLISGLMIWIHPDGDGFAVTLLGEMQECDNREFAFNAHGEWIGVGSAVSDIPDPG